MQEFDDLRSFVAVAEGGGFNRAARQLGVSNSMISRRIARLEADLGAQLLVRQPQGVSLTAAGDEFKLRCDRILADLAAAREAVSRQTAEVHGCLRLSCAVAFGLRHVAPVLAELVGRYPALQLDVSYSDRFVDVIGERFDAAIRVGNLPDSDLIARQIAPSRVIVAASPAYLLRHGHPQRPEDLLNHACLIYADAGRSTAMWRFRSGRRTVVIRPSGPLRTDNAEAILLWALSGLGIGEFPSFMVAEAIERGDLVPLLESFQLPAGGVHVVRPPGPYLPAKVRVLIDLLVARLGGSAT